MRLIKPGFREISFSKNRFGQESGTPVEIMVQHNNDEVRKEVVSKLVTLMKAMPALVDVEVNKPLNRKEYTLLLDTEKMKRLSISPADISSTIRASLEGDVLFELLEEDEEIDVRLTIPDTSKTSLESLLELSIENNRNYLVPLKHVVAVREERKPSSINRLDRKRFTTIDSSIVKESKKTPLEIADQLEATVFPQILAEYPDAALTFQGEIKDSKNSKADFRNAILGVIILMFIVLAILFNSVVRPLMVLSVIPLGLAGVIVAFVLHGKLLFGFYAAIGVLGLCGIIINDAIVMLVKLHEDYVEKKITGLTDQDIANAAQTRLRAITLTTLTTVSGLMPTAYGLGGSDPMLTDMMIAMSWGLIYGTLITLFFIPCLYAIEQRAAFSLRNFIQRIRS